MPYSREEFQHSPYATNAYLLLGRNAHRVLTGQMRVTMDIPRQATTTTHRPPPADPSVSTAPTSTTNNNTTATTAAAAASDAKLSRRLDQLRRSVASQHGGLFPHAVLSSHHLFALSQSKPASMHQLTEVIGQRRADQFGDQILAIIAEHVESTRQAKGNDDSLPGNDAAEADLAKKQFGVECDCETEGVTGTRHEAKEMGSDNKASSGVKEHPIPRKRGGGRVLPLSLTRDSSGPTSLTSQLNLKPRNYHDHPNSSKMGGILSSNRKKDLLLPFAGPSPPGSSSGDNPKADNQTSGPDLSAEEKRRQKLRDNMFKDGELGKRGEEYVAIQMLLFAGIAFPPDFLFSSFLPLAFFEPSDVWYLNYVVGAALLGIGGWFSSNAVKDLGTNLSPFPKPPTDSELETGGTYAIVRHPIYSGALLVASGLTLLTCSTGRGILTALLLILFDKKAAVEEGFLTDKYGPPGSPQLLQSLNHPKHPQSLKMRNNTSFKRETDPLLPFAGPSPPGSSSGGDPEAGSRTSDPASAASGPALSSDEQRRQKLRDNFFKDDGEWGKRGEIYVVLQFLIFAGIIFPPDFLFSHFIPGSFFQPSEIWYLNYVIGAALLGIGVWLSSKGAKDIGTNLSPYPKPPPDSELETGGLFAVVRHPLYGSALLIASGITLLTNSTGRGSMTVLLLVLFDRKATAEEGYLIEKFGQRYLEYKARVKKLIPYVY
ncbi:unnamed protein product [Closterium sp. NIES-54]